MSSQHIHEPKHAELIANTCTKLFRLFFIPSFTISTWLAFFNCKKILFSEYMYTSQKYAKCLGENVKQAKIY
jgi:hypothetical protein